MKKWLCTAAVLAAVGLLSRLPHPAKDISKLVPVRLVYLYMEADDLYIETDTGERGKGRTLPEAEADLRAKADGEIFLETAEFLLLDPDVTVTDDLCQILRPTCKVIYIEEQPDLPAAAQYLSAHPPDRKLAELRARSTRQLQ